MQIKSKPFLRITAGILFVLILALVVLQLTTSRLILPAPGKVLPSKEWVVFRDNGDQIVSRLTDHLKGVIYSQTTLPVVRGDNLNFQLSGKWSSSGYVRPGDTLGYLQSPDFMLWKQNLQNQKRDLESELALVSSGGKPELVRQAENELKLAEAEEEFTGRQLARQKELFAKNMISGAEYELSETAWKLARSKKEVARSVLEVYRSGEKPQLVDQIRTRLSGISQQLSLLPSKEKAFTLITPLAGRLFQTSSSLDTLLWVGSDPNWIVKIPVDYAYRTMVQPGQPVQFKTLQGETIGEGRVVFTGNQATLLSGRQVVEIIAEVLQTETLAPGLYVTADITVGEGSGWESLLFFLNRPRH